MKTTSERFWAKVEVTETCWVWLGSTATNNGYGRFKLADKHVVAHRFSYEEFTGQPVPEGLVLDHLCRRPSCVRPDHLEAVTHQENCRRGDTGKTSRIRAAGIIACPEGHAYTLENTRIRRGKRECRECGRIRSSAYYHSRVSPHRTVSGPSTLETQSSTPTFETQGDS